MAAECQSISHYSSIERPSLAPVGAPTPRAKTTWRDIIYLLSQILLVAAVELTDDFAHALIPHANAAVGLANAVQVASFESAHDLWVEPGIQSFFAHPHSLLGFTVGWSQVETVVDTLYGQGHVLFTLAFAVWVFFWRRNLFGFIRNIFLLTNSFAVLLYESFPLAPPRLATGLQYDNRPYHFIDAVFGGAGGLKLGFNQYAAMPSVHVAWALIVGLTLAWVATPLLVRLMGLAYPIVMILVVIVSGNHYLLDAAGAVGVVFTASTLAFLYTWWRTRAQTFGEVIQILHELRLPERKSARAG